MTAITIVILLLVLMAFMLGVIIFSLSLMLTTSEQILHEVDELKKHLKMLGT